VDVRDPRKWVTTWEQNLRRITFDDYLECHRVLSDCVVLTDAAVTAKFGLDKVAIPAEQLHNDGMPHPRSPIPSSPALTKAAAAG
jgi:hypothetical protein